MAESTRNPELTASAEAQSQAQSQALAGGDERSGVARLVLVVLAIAVGFGVVPRLTSGYGCGRAEDAPDFSGTLVANAPDPAKTTFNLSEFRGHPVLLDFWATWCGPCQAEMPIINGVASRFKDQGLVVLGVNTSDAEGLAARFVARRGVTFPIVYDVKDAIAQKFDVHNLPTLILISKEGKIMAVRQGVTSDADLERLIRRAL